TLMRNKFELQDYEPVMPSPSRRYFDSRECESDSAPIQAVAATVAPAAPAKFPARAKSISVKPQSSSEPRRTTPAPLTDRWTLSRGHSLTYLGLFVFTFLVYFRPYELFPSLAW